MKAGVTSNGRAAHASPGVAITGMACLFPSAPDLDAYWRNILHKVDAVSDPPPDAWDTGVYFDPTFEDADKVYCQRGGYLGSLLSFDPLPHGIPPVAVGGEPDQWIALQIARDALADAGCEDLPPDVRHRTGIVLGKGTYLNGGNAIAVQRGLIVGQTLELLRQLHPDLGDDDLDRFRAELKGALPPIGPETVAGLIPNIIVGRIANRLDLMGPTYTVDAACASSLVAIQLAIRDLQEGRSDLALAGGSQLWIPVPTMNVFCQLGALSRRERIRPFDKDADGTLLGEGIGMVVLKRLADAVADGDRIYAVVRGVGVASDGRGASVMAPRLEGEELALRRAYEDAGVAPETVGLIEAHGTATQVGDLTEVQAMSRVFGPRRGTAPRCGIGTVKSMISHTIPAAGVAGIIKLALSLYHKVLPPTLGCDEPNPRLELDKTPFYINTETRPWIHGGPAPRRAGINAFGFGGINAHAVLEEYEGRAARPSLEQPVHAPPWDSEVCVLESDSAGGLAEQAVRLAAALEGDPPFTLTDLAYTLSRKLNRTPAPLRLAVVATSLSDLRAKLADAAKRLAAPGCTKIRSMAGVYFAAAPLGRHGKTVFLFPGEGAQYPGMLTDTCLHFPAARAVFDRADRLNAHRLNGELPSDQLFPPPVFGEEQRLDAEQRLVHMDIAVEAVLLAGRALHEVVTSLGVRADACVGHSSGEYSAALASGVLDVDSDERMAAFSRALEDSSRDDVPRALLLAVAADRQKLDAVVREAGGDVFVAMDNCPHQGVLVGERGAVARARAIADREGLIYEELGADRAVHTPLFAPHSDHLREVFAGLVFRPGRTPFYSCTTSAPYPDDPAAIRELLLEHWTSPVEFRRTIERLYEDGARLFVEVGPRGNLTSFTEDILRGREHCAVPSDVRHRSGVTQINHLVAQLAAQGVAVDPTALFAHRNVREIDWEEAARQPRASASTSRINLAWGWPMLRLSAENAAELRGRLETAVARHAVAGAATSAPAVTAQAAPAPVAAAGSPAEAPAAAPAAPMAASPASPAAAIGPAVPVPVASASPPGGDLGDPVAAVVSDHLATMDRFLEVTEQVMQAYLQGAATAPTPTISVPVPATVRPALASGEPAAPEPVAEPVAEPAAQPAAQPAAPVADIPAVAEPVLLPAPAAEPMGRREMVAQQLLELMSERTGYPVDMLGPDLDLEADLGIDSIKRVEILGNYRQKVGGFEDVDVEQLAAQRTIESILDVLAPVDAGLVSSNGGSSTTAMAPPPATPTPPAIAPGQVSTRPLLGSVERRGAAELVARRRFDPAEDRYLGHHVLGRGPSVPEDGRLGGLAVMPLAMSLEIVAEAAAELVPDRTVVGLRDVRGRRWLAWGDAAQTLEVTARLLPGEGADSFVAVALRDHEHAEPAVEATVVLAEARPVPPVPAAPDLGAARRSSRAPRDLYAEGGMFHGPLWQGVQAMELTADRGATARLEVLPFGGFFRSEPDPRFVLDPITLDAAGQVIGFWAAEQLATANVVFPFRLESLDVYGPALRAAGEQLAVTATVTELTDHTVRSDIDVVDGGGLVWMRLTGWEDKRFEVPDCLRPLVVAGGKPVSTEWLEVAARVAAPGDVECRRIGAAMPTDRSFWKRVWAQRVLHPNELVQLDALTTPEPRQIQWLAGRTAAKESVRQLLLRRDGDGPPVNDLEIQTDPNGQPVVAGHADIALSIAHSGDHAVAIATWGPYAGIDIEELGRHDNGYATLAFNTEEQALLGELPPERRGEWLLRCWCAKEAAAKATGRGLIEGPPSVSIVAVDVDDERIAVRLEGELARAHSDLATTDFAVHAWRDGDLVVAVTRAEASSRQPAGSARRDPA